MTKYKSIIIIPLTLATVLTVCIIILGTNVGNTRY